MEALVASAIGVLTAGGVYLLLRQRSFPVVIGTTLLSYAVNLFLFASGRLALDLPPILGANPAGYSDPLPQALVLTAIVISFGMTAVVVMIALGAYLESGSDAIDTGRPDEEAPGLDAPDAGPEPAPPEGPKAAAMARDDASERTP